MDQFETVKTIASTIGLLIFVGMFAGVVVWALRPGARRKFEEHAQSILNEDDSHGLPK